MSTNEAYYSHEHKSPDFINFMEELGFVTDIQEVAVRFVSGRDKNENIISFQKSYHNKNPLCVDGRTSYKIVPIKFSFWQDCICLSILERGQDTKLNHHRREKDLKKDLMIVEKLIRVFINLSNISYVIYARHGYRPDFFMINKDRYISVRYDFRIVGNSILNKETFAFKIDEDDLENSKFYTNKKEYSLIDLSEFYENYLKFI